MSKPDIIKKLWDDDKAEYYYERFKYVEVAHRGNIGGPSIGGKYSCSKCSRDYPCPSGYISTGYKGDKAWAERTAQHYKIKAEI